MKSNRPRRLEWIAAVLLVLTLSGVGYSAATQNRMPGPITVENGALTVARTDGAGRTFSIDVGADSSWITLKSGDGGLDAVMSSDDTGTFIAANAVGSATTFISNLNREAGTGIVEKKYTQTLSSGTVTAAFTPAGSVIHSCSPPAYAQSTVRSYAINIGYVPNTRTYTIKLGGGGTTNDAVTGTCLVDGPLG